MNKNLGSSDKIIEFAYEVRYENGSSHFLHSGLAESLEKAITISTECILGCLPKEVDPKNLVRPIIARRLGICALCGSDRNLEHIPLHVGHDCQVCRKCSTLIKKLDS